MAKSLWNPLASSSANVARPILPWRAQEESPKLLIEVRELVEPFREGDFGDAGFRFTQPLREIGETDILDAGLGGFGRRAGLSTLPLPALGQQTPRRRAGLLVDGNSWWELVSRGKDAPSYWFDLWRENESLECEGFVHESLIAMTTIFPVPRIVRLCFMSFSILMGSFSLVSCGLFGLAASAGMIKLQFGCLPEGTMIDTPSGRVPVEQLETGDQVIGYDGQIVVVRQLHQYQEDATQVRHLKVIFESGREVQLSPRHRIGGTPAGELKQGDQIGENVVVEVQSLGGVSRSFDLLTDDAGYQVNGIPVNSMILEKAAATKKR